jgi:hypothetical protein
MKEFLSSSKTCGFKNPTTSDFVCMYNSKEYTFKAGSVTKLPENIAYFFARKLATSEISKEKGIRTDYAIDKKAEGFMVEYTEQSASDVDRIITSAQEEVKKEVKEVKEIVSSEVKRGRPMVKK